jgi:beta-lactamase regulating signal transducer with metallopeptidase domain
MNPTFDHWVQVAGWTLVHFVWQGGLIALAGAAALRFLRTASAQARYGIACAALAAMLVSPAMTARVISTSAQAEQPTFQQFVFVGNGLTAIPRTGGIAARPVHEGLGSADAWLVVNRWLPVLVSTWLAGVALLLVRLSGGWWRVRRLHRASLAAAVSSWQVVGDRLGLRLHLGRMVHIVDSVLVETPTVIGWLRPVIILPIAAFANLTPAQVEAILAHELAHIRRHDYLVNLLQTMAETLLFYHPAVWWVSARIRAEREHCCDAVAVDACGDAVGYAAALAELETSRLARPAPIGPTALALAATGGSLVERVRRVLSVQIDDARPARSETCSSRLARLGCAASLRCKRAAHRGLRSSRCLFLRRTSNRMCSSGLATHRSARRLSSAFSGRARLGRLPP